MSNEIFGNLTADNTMLVTRWFNARPEIVWKAWTDPVHLNEWFGPHGFSITTIEHSLKEGGDWRFIMHGPDGVDYPNRVHFTTVLPCKELCYEQFDTTEHNGGESLFTVRVVLEPESNGTRLTMISTFASGKIRDRLVSEYGADKGALETLLRLGRVTQDLGGNESRGVVVLLTDPRTLIVSRVVHASRNTVFGVWTDSTNWHRWIAPEEFTLVRAAFEATVGGELVMWHRMPNGMEGGVKGVILGIHPPMSIQSRETFEMDGVEPITYDARVQFEDHAGETTVTITQQFHDVEGRNWWFTADADGGMQESFLRLDSLLNV